MSVLLGVVLVSVGCDRGSKTATDAEADSTSSEPGTPARQWVAPEPTELTGLEPSGARELQWSSPNRYPECREFFEPEGRVRETFPQLDPSSAEVRAGCNPEAWVETEERRFLAYRVPVDDSDRRDLRFVQYNRSGDLVWSHRIERKNYGDDFLANFLGSFIVPLPPHVACAGTRWQGGTQVACLRLESGEVAYSGRLSFWSAIPLQRQATSLVGADVSGLTRRYPYSGVEMERQNFESTGGHGALYITDGRRLLFASGGEPNRLTGYGFEDFEPLWRLELPGAPEVGPDGAGLAGFGVALVQIETVFYAVDAAGGRVEWAVDVGDAEVEVAHDDELVYLMRHRSEKQNQLIAIDPEDGSLEWWGHVPLGTLDVEVVEGEVFVESVRAVQRLTDRGTAAEEERE